MEIKEGNTYIRTKNKRTYTITKINRVLDFTYITVKDSTGIETIFGIKRFKEIFSPEIV